MYSGILVAMDDSACSWLALEHALGIACLLNTFVTVVTVVEHVVPMDDLDFDSGGVPPSDPAGLRLADKVLTKAQRTLSERRVRGAALSIDSDIDTVADAINRTSTVTRSELLVMGTHGRRGLSRILRGSVAEIVIKQALISVLLVRHCG
jgi:nucleotide-binding universal stress UspA family protein